MPSRNEEDQYRPFFTGKRIGGIVGLVVIVLVIVGLVASSYYSVGVSQQAIIVNPYDQTVTLGATGPTAFASKNPFASIVLFSTAIHTVTLDHENTITGLTKDNLNVTFDVVVNYNVRGDKVIDLYKKYPSNNPVGTIEDSRIIPIIRASVRDVVAIYSAENLQTVRAELQLGIESRINQTLTSDPSLVNAIIVGQINLKHIGLPNSYLASINAKLSAQQDQQRAVFEAQTTVIQAQARANATIQQALGNARAIVIQADATRQSQIIVTNGTATAINEIATRLNLNATQRANLVQTYVFMQQLQQLCAQAGNPCANMFLFIGANGTPTIFQLPTTKP